jgi:flagellar hook-associated protein 1
MSADLFNIGASGLKGYRAQMGAISENIANANTANYSRRSVTLTESSVSASNQILYSGSVNFGGTQIAGVTRANDSYLDANTRLTGSALGNANSRLSWMSDIETSLSDDSLGVGNSLNNFYGAVTQLAANPADTSLRSNMLYGLERVATAFTNAANGLKVNQQSMFENAKGDAEIISNAMSELARINGSLLRAQPGTSNQAMLLDSRDAELSKITAKMNVEISLGSHGMATVTYGGATMVQGETASSISVTQNADGTLNLLRAGAAVAAPTDGALGGTFESASIATQRVTKLDSLAAQFTSDINAWHTQGLTDAGAAGGALLTIGASAASMVVAISNISDIAAKSPSGAVNGNLLNINSVRGASGVEAGWSSMISTQANALNTVKLEQGYAQTRDENARAARDSVSGVDMDTEAADLLRTQQAYQACARVVQIARQSVDDILKLI